MLDERRPCSVKEDGLKLVSGRVSTVALRKQHTCVELSGVY